MWQVIHGDCLLVMAEMKPKSIDAVITDPPYSSGGMIRADRTRGVSAKYGNESGMPEFSGDGRDQRAYGYWTAMWMSRCHDLMADGAVVIVFSDWRQLPTTTDSIQAGGFIWRGIVPWVKPSCRPQSGRFSAQCEYAVWGSKGPMPTDYAAPSLPGFYEALSPRDRSHITQKPLSVMRSLVRICPPNGTVLDPFCGSGTTGVAAILEGRDFIGIEKDEHFVDVSKRRISEQADRPELGI